MVENLACRLTPMDFLEWTAGKPRWCFPCLVHYSINQSINQRVCASYVVKAQSASLSMLRCIKRRWRICKFACTSWWYVLFSLKYQGFPSMHTRWLAARLNSPHIFLQRTFSNLQLFRPTCKQRWVANRLYMPNHWPIQKELTCSPSTSTFSDLLRIHTCVLIHPISQCNFNNTVID